MRVKPHQQIKMCKPDIVCVWLQVILHPSSLCTILCVPFGFVYHSDLLRTLNIDSSYIDSYSTLIRQSKNRSNVFRFSSRTWVFLTLYSKKATEVLSTYKL